METAEQLWAKMGMANVLRRAGLSVVSSGSALWSFVFGLATELSATPWTCAVMERVANSQRGLNVNWPCGLMDKALVFGTKDCRLESCQGHGHCYLCHKICFSPGREQQSALAIVAHLEDG